MGIREQQKAFKEAKKAAKEFKGKPGIKDVQFGYKYTNGVRQPELCLRINVDEKKPKKDLKKREIIPAKISSFYTDVIVHKVSPQNVNVSPSDIIRPVLGGLQIQSNLFGNNENWGTLGCIINLNGKVLGLTNYHVVFGNLDEIRAALYVGNLTMLQPQRTFYGEVIGSVGDIFNKELDYSTIPLTAQYNIHQTINMINGIINTNGYKIPEIGIRVFKIGASTGKTYGIIDGRSCFECANLIIAQDINMPSVLISNYGDSGAVWICEDNGDKKIIALHCGGIVAENIAYAKAYSSVYNSIIKKI